MLTNAANENPIFVAFGDERDSAMDRGNLADLTAFVAVADRLSFRAAASQLGVTPSALSHSMRQLEDRLGVRLLNRTTRSVSVTDAGLRLLEQLRPAIDQITGALEELNETRQRPMGRLRIYALPLAAAAVIAPIWERFLSTYPEVHLELAVRRIGASSSGGAAFRTIIPRLNFLLREPDRRNRPAPGMAPMEIRRPWSSSSETVSAVYALQVAEDRGLADKFGLGLLFGECPLRAAISGRSYQTHITLRRTGLQENRDQRSTLRKRRPG
jgi:Bacterial regulatory helix-turn-helix protein, lysR family